MKASDFMFQNSCCYRRRKLKSLSGLKKPPSDQNSFCTRLLKRLHQKYIDSQNLVPSNGLHH